MSALDESRKTRRNDSAWRNSQKTPAAPTSSFWSCHLLIAGSGNAFLATTVLCVKLTAGSVQALHVTTVHCVMLITESVHAFHTTTVLCVLLIAGSCHAWYPRYHNPLCIGDCRKWSRFPRNYSSLCIGDCRKWSHFPRYHSPVCNADCWKYNYVMVTLSTLSTLPQSFVYWRLQEVHGHAFHVTTIQCVMLFACRRYRSLVCNAGCRKWSCFPHYHSPLELPGRGRVHLFHSPVAPVLIV